MKDLTPELQAEPMGWLARDLAEGGPPPVVIRDAQKTGSTRRSTLFHEITLIAPHDGQPARLVVTNQYTGGNVAWELPRGIRLIAVSTENEET